MRYHGTEAYADPYDMYVYADLGLFAFSCGNMPNPVGNHTRRAAGALF